MPPQKDQMNTLNDVFIFLSSPNKWSSLGICRVSCVKLIFSWIPSRIGNWDELDDVLWHGHNDSSDVSVQWWCVHCTVGRCLCCTVQPGCQDWGQQTAFYYDITITLLAVATMAYPGRLSHYFPIHLLWGQTWAELIILTRAARLGGAFLHNFCHLVWGN